MVQALPLQVLFGIYLGLLTGLLPGLIAFTLGFLFKYFTGVTLPGFGVVTLGVAIAGINGGLLGLIDPAVQSSPMLLVAAIVVMMITLYTHSMGDKLGAEFPKRLSLKRLREQKLSRDVLNRVGVRGEIQLDIVGPVGDMEGYPPLSADLRKTIKESKLTVPPDLPLSELETRLADRLRNDHDLADVSVTVDANAKASVNAAPPSGRLSRRVPKGKRAISIEALLPTGVARGDEVVLQTTAGSVTGPVVAAQSDGGSDQPPGETPAEDDETPIPAPHAPTTTGGEGRITVAVDRTDAKQLLGIETGRVVTQARGTRREYELVSLLRRAGKRFKKLTVRTGGDLDGRTLGDIAVRSTYDVAVLAVKRSPKADTNGSARGWVFAPRGETMLAAGDELFVVGTRDALAGFAEVAA
ncbi:potassium channel family protein [Haladaptatus sp. ZSTT2]|uniref:potassium channel family protein n=1 Tax=Haladaptatus sp. ZSTT2 TaxID=3120515 RepID=UPI00300E9350